MSADELRIDHGSNTDNNQTSAASQLPEDVTALLVDDSASLDTAGIDITATLQDDYVPLQDSGGTDANADDGTVLRLHEWNAPEKPETNNDGSTLSLHGGNSQTNKLASEWNDRTSRSNQSSQATQDDGSSRGTPQIPSLQTVVQITVYRENLGRFEYLVLKRIDEDNKFWQVVTEPVASSSTIADTVRSAASEQIGVRGFKNLNSEMHSYEWFAGGERGRDIVFAAELDPRAAISIDTARFSEYAWLPAEEAAARLKWNGNKQALLELDRHLVEYRQTHPLPPSIVAETKMYNAGAAPKRLPDLPPNPHPTDLDGLPLVVINDDAPSTSALFL